MCHVKKTLVPIVLWVILMCLIPQNSMTSDCDLTIQSKDGQKNGTFQSPNYPRNYRSNLRCIYKFIGLPNERVQVKFVTFQIKGVPPRCVHDYLDIYIAAKNPYQDLLDIDLHGRYCGSRLESLPHLLITMSNVLILGFYTDATKNDKGFQGLYTFIDATPYEVGTRVPIKPKQPGRDALGFIIQSKVKPTGFIQSPTYPGVYTDNLKCFYKLQGQQGQRIKLHFLDMDLYSGGDHCPYDSIKVFDGFANDYEMIGTYCGKPKNLILYSTGKDLTIEFSTKSGRVPPTRPPYYSFWPLDEDTVIKRKGFKASYEFSRRFVDLSFIKEGVHIRGTECDQRVLSTGESNGTITSPNYPANYPLNVTCYYYIDGLKDDQNLEKACLKFITLNIPSETDRCNNGYLNAYLNGQDLTKGGPNKVLCGDHPPSEMLISNNPRLVLKFNTTGKYSGRGFKAQYQFLTDYAIPGTPATNGATCHFHYYSTSSQSGYFNSPRHPSNYPVSTECIFDFIGRTREQIRITFQLMKVEDRYHNGSTDWIKAYNIETIRSSSHTTERLVGHYGGMSSPGPLLTEHNSHQMKFVFHSDASYVNRGFRAKYEFLPKQPFSKQCFYNITGGYGGMIRSPNWPNKYKKDYSCDWHIYAHWPKGRIMLQFVFFQMEGDPTKDQGCSHAVLKIYTDNSSVPSKSVCGLNNNLTGLGVVSKKNYLRMRFISAASAKGERGFRITWTELLPNSDGFCQQFRCKYTGYCIANKLQCNKEPNCGPGDESDETEDICPRSKKYNVLYVILGVVITLVLLVLILVCILHRRRKVRMMQNRQEIEVRYVTRGATRAGDKLLLKERTEKVSIV